MEIDLSPESVEATSPRPRKRIVQRLSQLGISWDTSLQEEYNLVSFVKCHKWLVKDLTFAILPHEDDEVDREVFRESMVWLQWLMFEEDPKLALGQLNEVSSDQRGVCGAVWGDNDIAYRCRTCEHDPTCAICVPCFENGDHKDHDYSIIYTVGGCCDCGDITAWKREGFCFKHKGAEQIQPLPAHIAESLGPVLDVLLNYWKDVLSKYASNDSPRNAAGNAYLQFIDELTSNVVKMLLDFCKHHESLLSFISVRVYSSADLLGILMMAEKFLSPSVFGKLHELLLKMLGEPAFKYEFAKVFVLYYPSVVNATIGEASKAGDAAFKKCTLLSILSVQILTVPTLAPRLVEEMDLMGALFQCLENIFNSCAGEDGRLQVAKWSNLYDTTVHVIEDIRYVMSHPAVPKYLFHKERELVRKWLKLLAFVQGMNTLKRETGSHIEVENENVHLPFVLCHSLSNILLLLVTGAFSVDPLYDGIEGTSFKTFKRDHEDQCIPRQEQFGISQGSKSFTTGDTVVGHENKATFTPPSAFWLIYECLKSIENWLGVNSTFSLLAPLGSKASDGSSNNFLILQKTLSKFREGTTIFKPPASPEDLEEGLRILNSSTWPDITFDVSSQEISVHFPLHQLLSMMLRRALKECFGENVNSCTAEWSFGRKCNFFEQILNGCHRHSFAAFLMEHPLRIRVFCAQVHSRMWRRNGDTPIIFSEWYRSVRWSEQGQELDLFLLQVCASLAPPDLFVLRILERFGLSSYLALNLGHAREHEPIMVTEMLTLFIQIVKERRFCGLTTEQYLLRELVYKLSVGDATHSQLVKLLSHDLSEVDELQEVLDRVAEYSRPSGMTQGTYKLRLTQWKELDLYHPRWNLRDQQVALERYSRFCNVSALTTQLPKWSKIYHPLSEIAKIATCKSLLQIIRAVLFYAVLTDKSTTSRAPDGVLLTALHLLSLSLDVCRFHKKSGDKLCYVDDSIPFLAFATEEISMSEHGDHSMLSLLFSLVRKENAQNVVEAGGLATLVSSLIRAFAELEPSCAEKLQKLSPQGVSRFLGSGLTDDTEPHHLKSESEMRKAKARERQAAILENMRNQQSKFLESFSNKDDEMDDIQFDSGNHDPQGPDTLESNVICSLCHEHKSDNPVSFLVLLQKSRISSFVDQGPRSWDQHNLSSEEHAHCDTPFSNESSSAVVSDTPELITLNQLEDWVQIVVDDFASTGQPAEVNSFMDFSNDRFPSVKNSNLPSTSKMKTSEQPIEKLEEHAYLLVRESLSGSTEKSSTVETIDNCSKHLLLGKYIDTLPEEPKTTPSAFMKLESRLHPDYDNMGPSGNDGGIYISSCGHAVHQGCLDRYLTSLKERNIRRIVFEGVNIVDPAQGEFLCPVCRGLANSALPTLPGNLRKVPNLTTRSNTWTGVGDFFTLSDVNCSLRLQCGLSLVEKTANIVCKSKNVNALPLENIRIANLEPIVHLLCEMYYPGQDNILETGRVSSAVILWHMLKYSLASVEISARSRKSSLCPSFDCDALYKELNSSTGFILSLLLDVVQNVRMSYQTVLLRFHAIQLFSKSLCCGAYSDELRSYRSPGRGNALYILEDSEMAAEFPDTQLWRLASEPIIAHDSFSSFMWMLFCLPWPMLSCRDSYFSLVHVFYVVSLTQAIIICHHRRKSFEIGKGLHDSMITDIFQVIGEHPEAGQYFQSCSMNPTYGILDAISSLLFPFLRRCALLWKLINGSVVTPFNYGSNHWDGFPFSENHPSNNEEEILEVDKLKKYFNIPPDSSILNDKNSRSTALAWLSHFCEVVEAQKCQRVLRCTPAIPFKLMLLPHLYQDLLQRYIKKACPECGVVREEPALCLLCGKLCSPNWKTCCRESGCQTHAATCSSGLGVFLMIKRTTVLLQRSARRPAHWPSPYLDAFGEEDIDMRRGKPLFLNEERYAALTHMVASHGVHRSSEVLRQTTMGTFFAF